VFDLLNIASRVSISLARLFLFLLPDSFKLSSRHHGNTHSTNVHVSRPSSHCVTFTNADKGFLNPHGVRLQISARSGMVTALIPRASVNSVMTYLVCVLQSKDLRMANTVLQHVFQHPLHLFSDLGAN
jgi:hypothetical protein